MFKKLDEWFLSLSDEETKKFGESLGYIIGMFLYYAFVYFLYKVFGFEFTVLFLISSASISNIFERIKTKEEQKKEK